MSDLPLLYSASEVAARLGITERAVLRFARKHAIPLICAFSKAAVDQLEDAACPTKSVSLSEEKTPERFGPWESSGRLGRLTAQELDSARESVRQKLQQRRAKSSGTRPRVDRHHPGGSQ